MGKAYYFRRSGGTSKSGANTVNRPKSEKSTNGSGKLLSMAVMNNTVPARRPPDTATVDYKGKCNDSRAALAQAQAQARCKVYT